MIARARIPLYQGQVIVVVSDKAPKILEKHDLPSGFTSEEARQILGWVQESPYEPDEVEPGESQGRWIVCLRPSASLNIVAHEAQHLVNYICKWYGLPSIDDDEPQAYLTGWAVEWLWGLVEKAR